MNIFIFSLYFKRSVAVFSSGLILSVFLVSGISFADDSGNVARPVLKVCADPELMPLSNKAGEGMENKIAEFLAKTLGAELKYEWFPQRIGFIRNTLRAEEGGIYKCDLVLSVPEHFELAATTRPYYAATYSLVYVKGRKLDSVTEPEMIETLNSEHKNIRFGLFDRGPAQLWVLKHGLMDRMVPYQFQLGDPKVNPTEIILNDLYNGKIDATIVWGPTAAYFARQNKARGKLVILPLENDPKNPEMRFVFNMSMAVRHGNSEWKDQLNTLISEHQQSINEIIASYGIPIVDVVPSNQPENDD